MNKIMSLLALLLFSTAAFSADVKEEQKAEPSKCPYYLNHSFKILHSPKTVNLCELYTGQPLIIVNTASHCGYTRQFKGLEALYQKYKKEGVQVVGFASNDFKQAAKSEQEAATICYKNYGVTFTMLAPTHVRGDKANAVFAHLNKSSSKPGWNFNKYLISEHGSKVEKFGSKVEPLDSKLEKALSTAL